MTHPTAIRTAFSMHGKEMKRPKQVIVTAEDIIVPTAWHLWSCFSLDGALYTVSRTNTGTPTPEGALAVPKTLTSPSQDEVRQAIETCKDRATIAFQAADVAALDYLALRLAMGLDEREGLIVVNCAIGGVEVDEYANDPGDANEIEALNELCSDLLDREQANVERLVLLYEAADVAARRLRIAARIRDDVSRLPDDPAAWSVLNSAAYAEACADPVRIAHALQDVWVAPIPLTANEAFLAGAMTMASEHLAGSVREENRRWTYETGQGTHLKVHGAAATEEEAHVMAQAHLWRAWLAQFEAIRAARGGVVDYGHPLPPPHAVVTRAAR